MSRAWDEHEWRDVSPPGFMSVRELSPTERRAAEKAEERRMQKMKEDYAKSVTARREADAAEEVAMDAVVAKGSEIKTPAQERADKLGWAIQPDGSLVHKAELERRAAQNEPAYEGGPTPEETAAFERQVEEEDEESFWNDE
jgi:hypothetical protein